MAKIDYYEALGVERSADERTIKKAYRAMAMKYHPDRNPGDAEAEAQFKVCAEAYAVLSDGEKRSLYDRYGHAGLENQGFDSSDIFNNLGDFFSDLFGGGGFGGFGGFGQRARRDGPSRGGTLRTTLVLSLADCMTGTEREIELRHPNPCNTCDGTGAKDGELERCETCGGVGRVARRLGAGFITQSACPACHGEGMLAKERCDDCSGSGEQEVERKVRVSVPGGIDEGQQLRLSGKGQLGRKGGPAGDLYVDVRIQPEEGFGRDGYDLLHELEMTYPQAALGAMIQVPNLVENEEPIAVRVPAGTQPGETIVVQGAGFPRLDGRGRGDFICVAQVGVPKELSPRARELIEQLAEAFDA